jgi:hypothetical protein
MSSSWAGKVGRRSRVASGKSSGFGNSHCGALLNYHWLRNGCACSYQALKAPPFPEGLSRQHEESGLVIGGEFHLVKKAEASQPSLSPPKQQASTIPVSSLQISHNGAPSCQMLPVLQEQGEQLSLRHADRGICAHIFWEVETGKRGPTERPEVLGWADRRRIRLAIIFRGILATQFAN